MVNRPTSRLGKTKGRWITIGNPDRDEDEAGTHVYIDDSGTVTAGPESLTNRPVNRLNQPKPAQSERQRPETNEPSGIQSRLGKKKKPTKLGKSKAKITYESRLSTELQVIEKIDAIGGPGFHKDIASVVGAPDDAKVTVAAAQTYGNRIFIDIEHSSYRSSRTLEK